MAGTQDNWDTVFDAFSDRWPEAGDRLFVLSRAATMVASGRDERFYRLVLGYKRAADLLIEVAAGNPADDRNLVYPIVFCYRHYIELVLKRLIEEHGPAVGIAYEKNHDIRKLWDRFEALSGAYGCEDAVDETAVAACIAELARVDVNSFAFRFSETKAGESIALPEGIDLVALRDVMNGIENFFECADLEFSARNQ